jgi:two-component system, LytTR family, response regulator
MNVLVVDDEPLARQVLRRALDHLPNIVCVGECGRRDEAVAMILDRKPDVVLLDVQLGRTTGFEIIEDIGVDDMPLVIFVTAYDRHALKAFEVHALDYVLKPVDPDRLREALDRAASVLSLQRGALLADRLERLLAQFPTGVTPNLASSPASVPAQRLTVRDGQALRLLDSAQVEWIESAGNYVHVHSGGRTYVIRTTMDRVARRLAADTFLRVRRTALINTRSVARIERYGKGTYVVHLRSGAQVITGRLYQAGLRRLLES